MGLINPFLLQVLSKSSSFLTSCDLRVVEFDCRHGDGLHWNPRGTSPTSCVPVRVAALTVGPGESAGESLHLFDGKCTNVHASPHVPTPVTSATMPLVVPLVAILTFSWLAPMLALLDRRKRGGAASMQASFESRSSEESCLNCGKN